MYKKFIRSILFQQDPESVHEQVLSICKAVEHLPGSLPLLSKLCAPPCMPQLEQDIFGYRFQNPVGLAAGFDKNMELVKIIKTMGFGFEEAGSISLKASKGNPKPRMFRLPEDMAIINRMGLNNHGVMALSSKIRNLPKDWPVGISLVKTHDPKITGKDAVEDFASSFRAIYGQGAYVCLNISCPNTREGKTFENPEILEQLLKRIKEMESICKKETLLAPRPLLLKISPDLETQNIDEIFEIAVSYNISGWVACNTTTSRNGLKSSAKKITSCGQGGLSGLPLKNVSTRIIGHLYKLCKKHSASMVIIGSGGVHDIDSAWEKIIHGASLLQIYTGLVYEGPQIIKNITGEMMLKLEKHNFNNIKEAVGSAF